MVISFPNMAEQLVSDWNLKQKQKKWYVLLNFWKKIYAQDYIFKLKILPYLVLSYLHPKLIIKNCVLATIIKLGQKEEKGMSAVTGI